MRKMKDENLAVDNVTTEYSCSQPYGFNLVDGSIKKVWKIVNCTSHKLHKGCFWMTANLLYFLFGERPGKT